jgi:hypothetical protein
LNVCSAIVQASVLPLLLGRTDKLWIYNVSACYSDEDEIVSPRHYKNSELEYDVSLQSLWTRYTGPLAFDTLNVTGDHAHTLQLCAIDPLLFFTLQGYQPANPEDQGNYMPALSSRELAFCVPVVKQPTLTPIGPPTTSRQPTTTTPAPTKSPSTSVVTPTAPSPIGGPNTSPPINGNIPTSNIHNDTGTTPPTTKMTPPNAQKTSSTRGGTTTQFHLSEILFATMVAAFFLLL